MLYNIFDCPKTAARTIALNFVWMFLGLTPTLLFLME